MKNKPSFFIITTVSDSLPFFKGQLNVLKDIFDISLISNPGIHLDEMTKEYDVKGHPIKMKREISIVNDLVSLINLLLLFLKYKPKIVHGNTPKASLLSMIAAWIVGVPVRIYYIHGLRYQGVGNKKRKLLIMMEKVTCFFATDIIAVSQGIIDQLKMDNVTDKQISLIWNGSINGIDLAYFDPLNPKIEKASIGDINDEEKFIFGFVGRIVKDKGIDELMLAFDKLSKKHKNVKLIMLGNFENKQELNDNTLNIIHNNENVSYLGFQKDIRPYFKIMGVFVLPSYREGLCGVILEASAMEIPIIATSISGIKEVVKNGETGYLINPKDSEQLFTVMEECLVNKKDLERMSFESRKFVQNNYEQNKLWKKTKEKYLKIISDKNV